MLVKVVLLLALIALGAVNRRRVVPALQRLASGRRRARGRGRLLRRTLRAEVALVVVVLGVTGALTGYSPPTARPAGRCRSASAWVRSTSS